MPYLDHAGAGLPTRAQMDDISRMMMDIQLSNPHSLHSTSRTTHTIVENARQRILTHFNTNSTEYSVIFTANASHSMKIVAETFQFGKKTTDGQCQEITSDITGTGPSFAYLLDSHNSVVGLRDIVRSKVDHVHCLRHLPESIPSNNSRSLFALTAMSNFCGRKYDLDVIDTLQSSGFSVLLDAACLVSSSPLDLTKHRPHFTAISFYKMFGYPTGLGALIVRNDAAQFLHKGYFAGGTVASAIPDAFVSTQRDRIDERFEDGTLNYYAIASLQKGFEDLEHFGDMSRIKERTFSLFMESTKMLTGLFHWNGKRAVDIYGQENPTAATQGPIVSFNLKDDKGDYIGYSEVMKMADLFGIDLRTGCFCNLGACSNYLNLSREDLLKNIETGKKCGDTLDIVNGKPTGSVRISFGRQSTLQDIAVLQQMIEYCFIHNTSSIALEYPLPITNFKPRLSKICCFPVKSCKGFEVQSSQLTETGLLYDRYYMIMQNDVILTQKKYPQLLKIQTEVLPNLLHLSSENNNDIELPMDAECSESKTERSVVCVKEVSVVDCGDAVAGWLNAVLEMTSCRLRKVAREATRSLSNDSPYLVVNEASVKILADQIGLTLEEAIYRFRANLVLRGLPPFIEDTGKYFRIGGNEFEVTGKCTRCEMICVDQNTGEKDPSMIVALRNFRNREKMTFGIYIKQISPVEEKSVISVDDIVDIC